MPTGDDVPSADAAEQHTPAATDADTVADLPREVPDDASEADALEQALPAGPVGGRTRGDVPLEADDADAAEQSEVVPLDEDEARE
ncbi:MAG: hypothetical protein ACLGIG_03810 [Actinomycetes bacterium]